MKHRVISKIISCFLCTALTMQAGLALTVERVNAAGAGFITYSMDDEGYIVNLESYVSTTDFLISVDSDGEYDITYDSLEQDGNVEHFGHIYELRLNGGANAIIGSEVTIDNILLNDQSASLEILEGSKLTCVDIRGSGRTVTIQKGGILECDEGFVLSDISSDYIYVYGSIVSYKIDLTASRQNIYTSDDTVFKATTSFINGAYDLEGFVDTELSTYISSESGAFTLRAGGATKRISGQFSNKMAVNLLDNPNVTLNNVPDVYYGQDYDFSSLISTAEGYEGETYIEYADNMQNVLEEKPSYPYNFPYHVRAVASANGTYYESQTDWEPFLIQYLPLVSVEGEEGEDGVEGLYPAGTTTFVTVTGDDNFYVKDAITLTPPEGILIACPSSSDSTKKTFSTSVSLTFKDLFLDGDVSNGVNADFDIAFSRASDGATTASMSIYDVVPNIDKYKFDVDPQIKVYIVDDEDGLEQSYEPVIVANKIKISVSDENLSEVLMVVNGNEEDLNENLYTSSNGICEFFVQSTPGEAKDLQIIATDVSGRKSQVFLLLEQEREYVNVCEGPSGLVVTIDSMVQEGDGPFFTIDKRTDSYFISYRDPDSEERIMIPVEVDRVESIRIYGEIDLLFSIMGEMEADIYSDNRRTEIEFSSDTTFKCKNLSGYGSINNWGVFEISDYFSSDYSTDDCTFLIDNDGTIIADNIDISTTSVEIYGEEITTVSQTERSVYQAKSSFTKGDENLKGKVVADAGTVINSAGGTFTLQVGDVSKEISGVITNKTARELLSDDENHGLIIVDGNNVELQTTVGDLQTVTFTITKDSDEYTIECDKPDLLGDGETQTVGRIDKLSVNGGYCEVSIKADMEIELDLNGEWITVDIDNNAAVTCSDLNITSTSDESPNIIINIYGELIMTDFILSDYPYGVQFYNSGEIHADTVEISADTAYSHLENNTSVIVESSFTMSTNVLSFGFIVAGNEDTLIRSEGYFTLKYGDLTKEISGDVGPIEAIKLFDDPGITLDEIPDVNFGTNYNFSSYVHTATGYTGTPVLQYSTDGETYDSDKPVASGDYYIRAYAPASGSYREAYSEAQEFSIKSVANRGNIIVNGSAITLQTIGDANTVTFTITKESSGYTIECDHPDTYDGGTVEIAGNIDELTIDGYNINIIVKGDNNVITDDLVIEEIVFSGNDFTFTIEEDAKVRFANKIVSDENASGKIIIYGTLFWNNFNTGNWSNITFENYGQIYADTVDITYTGNLVCDSDSIIVVTDSFTMGTEDFEGTVIADNSYTEIVSAGGKFFLYLTGASDTFEGEINSTAGELLLDPIEIGFYIDDEPIITGESYDFIYYVYTNPSGYETYVRFEYAPYNSDEFTNTKPTAAGYYKVRAILDGSSEWLDSMSADHYYFIQDMALSDLFPDGNYHVTLDGYYNNYYIPEALVLKAPEGIMIGCPELLDGYYESVSLTYEDLEEKGLITDGHIDKDLVITFAKVLDNNSDELTLVTAGGITIDKVFSDIGDYTFDPYDPGFEAMIVDSEGGLVETSVDGDTDKVFADELRITVSDEFLSSVTLSVDGIETDLSDTIAEGGICEITLNATEGKTQEIKITAKDLAERTAVAEFTLYHEPVDPSLTVTLPDTIYYGDEINPVISIDENYDGEISVNYFYSGEELATETAPTNVGTYVLSVYAEATDLFTEASYEEEFEILKKEIDPKSVSVSVENIKVGQVPAPVVTGLPDDYDGEITFVYLGGNGENGSAESLAAGNYRVRATISDTNDYVGTTCETDLVVSKYDIAEAEVTIENIKVGEAPAPTLKGIPEDYDGEITFEYLGGNGENGSADSLPAGSYLVRVTIPETYKYEKKVLETDLVVSKNDITEVKVTVENIFVGQTPEPVVTGLPDDYDGEITFEYIDGNGEDCPADSLAAGGYHVIASIPETDKYERTICETDLEVKKNEVTANVSASDILVGGDVDPVITIDPEEYDGVITIEYKGDADKGYSTTVPTAAGSYSVRVTLSETDKYLGATCEDTFTISKNEATAEVKVADIYVGGTVNPVVTTESNGKVTFEYKLRTDPDTAYTKTVPTAAGEYTVRATIAATAEYLGTTCEDTFWILKKEATATVTVENIYVGELPNPVVKTVSDGKITFEYKLSADPDTAYTKTVPTAAGEYTVRATVAETETYLGTTCTAEFKISRNAVSATVMVADIYVGETPSPVVSTVSKGKVTFEYKPSKAPDTAYSETVPSAAGEYTVRATIAETDIYLDTTCTATFKINKIAIDASVSVSDILVGGTVNPVMTGIPKDYDGKVIYEYKAETADDTAYSSTVPSVAGEYTVRATVAETYKYLGTTCIGTFTISKNETTATVFVADIYVGGKVTPVVSTVSNGKDDATFEYKLSSDPDEAYSSTVPTAAGIYTVRATIPATVEYAGIVCTNEFKIMLNPVTKMELTVPDIYYGQPVKATLDTESNGTVTIMYKPFEAEDSEYTDKVPAAVGKYTALAIVSATDFYAGASVTVDFSISYLENPQIVYVPSGTPGDNGYYTSDVDLKAPDGFLISATPDGEFTDKIPFTEDLNVIYLKRIEDNALTAAITLENKPKIDKVAPVFTELTGGLVEDAILFIESMDIRVDDLNLVSLTVNGEAVDLTSNGANILTLTRPEEGYMTYHIVAIDVAGNVSILDITLMADWLKDRIIPVGKSLPLAKGELYFLDVGEWTVSIVNKDGTITESKTVFSGNMPFYVNDDADYIFTKVT